MSVERADVTRVLWLTKGLGRGGAETLLVEVARALQHEPFELMVAYVRPDKTALVPALEEIDVRTRCLSVGGSGHWPRRLRELLHSDQFDVVHTHAPVIASAARLLAPRDLPMAHTEHNTWRRYRTPTRWANAATFCRNSIVWPVSQGVADSIRVWPLPGSAPEIEVMLHGIAPGRIASGSKARSVARQRLEIPPDAKAIVSVGNLTPKKDHDNLVAAIRVLRQRHDVVLHIVGEGPRRAYLEHVIAQQHLSKSIRLLGTRNDVAEILPAYDAFAMSSLHEGLSIALLEAMAAGVPPAATRVGGIPELVAEGVHGLLVPPRDPVRLAGALDRLLSDPDLHRRLVEADAERAAEFGIDRAARRLATVYGELAGRTGTGAAA